MSTVTDFLHDEAIVDAVCDQLRLYLPGSWTSAVGSGGNRYFSLKRLEFGDLRDYRFEPEESWQTNCPMVLAKCTSNLWNLQYSGIGGKQGITYNIRVVHAFTEDQCRDTTTGKRISPARSRAQRLKKLNIALYQGATRQMGAPTLTCADSGVTAALNVCRFAGAYMEGVEDIEQLPGRYYAVAVDLTVITVTA